MPMFRLPSPLSSAVRGRCAGHSAATAFYCIKIEGYLTEKPIANMLLIIVIFFAIKAI